ncbi:MAG: SH3 domain-containing protein [Flavobacteriales bacterium]
MNLDDIRKKAEDFANRARTELNRAESTNEAQVKDAFDFLQAGGVNTAGINVNFENNEFQLSGTVETGEEMETLKGVLTNSGSSSNIVSNVELEDFTAKNVIMTVKTKGSNLNVRAGAGTENDIVGKFANGSQVHLVKKIQKDWYLVRNSEVEGYAHTNFLTI